MNAATHVQQVVMRHAGTGPVARSGDGKLVSPGGRIADGPSLPTTELRWGPTGERAAHLTKRGAVRVWSPGAGSRPVVPAGWGARAVAWSRDGRLAIGQAIWWHPHHHVQAQRPLVRARTHGTLELLRHGTLERLRHGTVTPV